MAYRRLTRSSSKTKEQQLPTATISSKNRSRRSKKQEQVVASDPMDDAMDWGLGWEQEAALDPVTDFSDLPACFQSQPTLSQKSASLSFGSELLRATETLPPDAWKTSCDADHELSSPATQLDMVSGIDQVLESSSLLYSPASVAPVPSPESAAAPLTTAEELLQLYLPSASAHVPDEDEAIISDEALLEDLDDILLSYQSDVPDPEDSLSHIHVGFNPPADTLALAMSSAYEPGLYVIEDQSMSAGSDCTTDIEPAPVAAPARKGKAAAAVVKKETPAKSTTKRGRKRKASSDSDCAEERKRRQNAEAAKNYRKRKAEQINKVFEEKEEVEKELEKVRKRLSAKMNERNILLKMLYESYHENADSAPHKILFPPWIQTWYQKQCDD